MPPTVLFVPGFWVGPTTFDQVSSIVHTAGFPTQTTELLSTGTTSPGNPSMLDDIAHLRSVVTKLVDADTDVVIVSHSGGAFLASNAIEGLGAKARAAKGLKGGVVKLVYVAGALFPEGYKHQPLPFFTYDGGAMHCLNPTGLLFNDLPESATQEWLKTLRSQPAAGWDDTITYCGWKDVPSVYLICDKDAVLPRDFQLQMAALGGCAVEHCDAGHMAMLSRPAAVAATIQKAAAAGGS